MKLLTNCSSCKAEIKINSYASTRPELEMDKGEIIKLKCKECGRTQDKHVNDVRAVKNNQIILGGFVISAIVTIILFFFVGLIGTITFAIPLIIGQQQNSSVHNFNSYRTRR